jgi:hypothetical protein
MAATNASELAETAISNYDIPPVELGRLRVAARAADEATERVNHGDNEGLGIAQARFVAEFCSAISPWTTSDELHEMVVQMGVAIQAIDEAEVRAYAEYLSDDA